MSTNYDLIATVSIDIDSPIVDDASFDNLLIVGPLPRTAPATAPALFAAYSSIDEVVEAGWSITGSNPDPVGLAAQVAFSQSPTPGKIYIAPIQVVNETSETAVTTVQRAMAHAGWWVVCTAGVAATEYPSIAAYIETQEKFFLYTDLNYFTGTTHTASVSDIYFRTAGIFAKETSDQAVANIPAANNYLNVAFAAKWLNYESGTETAAYKQLAGVYPSTLTSAEMKELNDAGLNYFVTVGNKKITVGGMVRSGEWMDIIRFRDWLKNDMQVRVVNQFITNPKIPMTDSGIALLQNQMLASLQAGQTIGGIAEDEFDEDGNTIPGFETIVPLASSLSDSDKASRRISGLKFKARLAGAIHVAELDGSLTYEL